MTSLTSGERQLGIRYQLTRAAFSLDVDFELSMQGVTGIFGPSGAGKTTLLRCMAGLEKSDAGRLIVDGEAWEDSSTGVKRASHRRQIAYVFQEARLFPHMNVSRNLEYGLRRSAAGSSALDFHFVVSLLALENLLDRRPSTLSGGEVQRVAIGRALLCSPKMILMDEPLAALDEARKEEVLPFIERLHAELETPIIFVSHNIDEICRLCDQLVVMDAGRVMTQGDLQSVLLQTEQPILSGKEAGTVLFGRTRDYDLKFDLTRVETAGSQLWVPGHFGASSAELRLRVRANDVSICLERPAKTSILNVIRAKIEGVQEESGASMLVHLRAADDHILARITRRSWSELGLQSGDTVFAQIKSIAVRNRPAS
jgi:molybdate transport system ATP-binding protein